MNLNHPREDLLTDAAASHPRFAAAVREPGSTLLTLAALVPEGLAPVDPEHVQRQAGFLAHLVAAAAGGTASPLARLAALRRVLVDEEGFGGSGEPYDDPANSYLDQVLERRCGLPIALSVLYLEIGRINGWPLVGLDFPLHFLVRYVDAGEPLVVDPYHGGEVVDLARCVELARPAFQGLPEQQLVALVRMHLDAVADPRRVVVRMLKNLEASFLRRHDYAAAKDVIEKLLLIEPTAPGELRDLGGVYHLLGDHQRALECLRGYLAEQPFAPDRDHVRAVVAWLREQIEDAGA